MANIKIKDAQQIGTVADSNAMPVSDGGTSALKITVGQIKEHVASELEYDALKGRVTALETQNGSETLTTDADTLSGAVNELDAHVDANTNDIATHDAEIDAIEDALEDKANKDGYYTQMTVGSAEGLVGGNEMSREITHGTAGGSADIADGVASIGKVKGNSLVWNQLVNDISKNVTILPNEKFSGSYVNGKYTIANITGEATTSYRMYFYCSRYNKIVIGHKYAVFYKVLDNVGVTQDIDLYQTIYIGGANVNIGQKISKGDIYCGILTVNSESTSFCSLNGNNISGKYINWDVDAKFEFQIGVFDLTQMFGAGNEPASVEEFNAMFPLDYYEYNAGEVLTLNATGIKTIGFNAYDHSTGKAVLLGGNEYQITGTYTSLSYEDINGNAETITPDSDGKFTPTNNGTLSVVGGNSTDTCVHLVWSGKRDGEYEQYWENTRDIPIAKINTDGTITDSAEGKTRLFPDGLCKAGSAYDEVTSTKAIKRIGKVDLGTLSWRRILGPQGDRCRYSGNTSSLGIKSNFNRLCSKFVQGTSLYDNTIGVMTYMMYTINCTINCWCGLDEYTSEEDFKAAMSGVYLYYELATPIEVTLAEPINLNYQVSDFGTEQMLPVNTAEPVSAPLTIDVTYGLNVVDFVRNADKNFVTIEASTGTDGSTFTNLRTALSNAFGIDVVPTWDATNGRYTFAVTDNRVTEVPASATDTGKKGQWAEDDDYMYFCTNTNVWVKLAKTAW